VTVKAGRVPYGERSYRNRYYISVRRNEDCFSRALNRGAPKQLVLQKPFLLETHIRTFNSSSPGLKTKSIRRNIQIDSFKKVYDNPFQSPYIYCIASHPNDAKASAVALHIMMQANRLMVNNVTAKGLPLWHILTGSYKDKLRDARKRINTSLLILSNVPENSSATKLEKLRDLLELYHDTPRILVTTGIDPVTFCHSYLYYTVNHVLNINSARVQRSV